MNFKYSSLGDLISQNNAHLQGVKRVFIANDETNSSLTQFAYGIMQPGQESGSHAHVTMDEYFYFIKGSGIYNIDEETINISPSFFIRVPAGIKHNLINNGDALLEFVYFGIAI